MRLAYNTIYVLDGSAGRVLIDAGPDYAGAAALIDEALGRALPEVVIATHGHLDHAGLARHWQERGVPVAMAAADAHLARGPRSGEAAPAQLARFVDECGAPVDVRTEMLAALARRRAWAVASAREEVHPPAGRDGRWPTGLRYRHFEADIPLHGDGELAGVEALACPGHTPGNFVVIDRSEGWLFSGDQLLPDATPTPAIQARAGGGEEWRFRSLPAFVASLESLAAMSFSRCFPGHGEPFDDVAGVIAANLGQVEQRCTRVMARLRGAGPETAYGVGEQLYPRALRRRPWQILGTVQGQLDVLEDRGQVRREGGRYQSV